MKLWKTASASLVYLSFNMHIPRCYKEDKEQVLSLSCIGERLASPLVGSL